MEVQHTVSIEKFKHRVLIEKFKHTENYYKAPSVNDAVEYINDEFVRLKNRIEELESENKRLEDIIISLSKNNEDYLKDYYPCW